MPRRIEIELTSSKNDGSWTWRAAGAREPKGVVDAGLLPGDAAVGAVLRAEVDTGLEGTTVLAVLAPKGTRSEPDRIELLGRADPDEWVTTTLARPDRGERRDRKDRPRRDRDDRGPRDGRSDRGNRSRGGDSERPGGPRGGDRSGPARGGPSRNDGAKTSPRPQRREEPSRPRPKRLRAGRVHRRAVLEELPLEHRPIAEQVLKGGIPAVRTAVEKQNEQARAEGQTEIKPDQLIDLAEKLLPRLRSAEWRDRADAALADIDELDLRDLRSVIVAAESGARDEESRAITNSLREGLAVRVEQEQANWLAEIASGLAEGRVVRALSLSSRPPKAGAPLPTDLADRLATAAAAALTSDTPGARWATVIDALSYSPVHLKVTPASVPAESDDALLKAIRVASSRVPQIAALFGIEPTPPPPERRRGQNPGRANAKGKTNAKKGKGGGKPRDEAKPSGEGRPSSGKQPNRDGQPDKAAETTSQGEGSGNAEPGSSSGAPTAQSPDPSAPTAVSEPAVASEPNAVSEPAVASEPNAVSEPSGASEPIAVSEPDTAAEPGADQSIVAPTPEVHDVATTPEIPAPPPADTSEAPSSEVDGAETAD